MKANEQKELKKIKVVSSINLIISLAFIFLYSFLFEFETIGIITGLIFGGPLLIGSILSYNKKKIGRKVLYVYSSIFAFIMIGGFFKFINEFDYTMILILVLAGFFIFNMVFFDKEKDIYFN